MAKMQADAAALDLAARIALAEAYPYARPASSYLFWGGAIRPLAAPRDEERDEGRVPVLACGSNAAPARLAAKYPEPDATVPVTRARLRGFAVVFAAHVTSYGAVPATLHPCPGAEVELFVTWLTAPQLERMHASEGTGQRYDYFELAGIDLRIEGCGKIDRAGAYLARNGALSWADRPIRLAEVTSAGATFGACSQPAMLRRLHARFAGTGNYTAFMLEVLTSATYRQTVSAALAASALVADVASSRVEP